MGYRTVVAMSIAAAGLSAPAAASAQSLIIQPQCVLAGQEVLVGFTGFAPDSLVTFTNDGNADVLTMGSDGGFIGTFTAGTVGDATTRSVTATAQPTMGGATVSDTYSIVQKGFTLSNPRSPRSKLTVRARGLIGGGAVYVHYAYKRRESTTPKLVRTVKLGTATGPCGLFTKSLKRALNVSKPKKGIYEIQVDGSKTYKRTFPSAADYAVTAVVVG